MDQIDRIRTSTSAIVEKMEQELNGHPSVLYEAASHLLTSGGKRLRPYIALKSFELLKGDSKSALQVASSVEFIHNFTLLHDDIMDSESFRHKVQTVHRKFGVSYAIIAGDVLFAKAVQVVTDACLKGHLPAEGAVRIADVIARSSVKVCEGQAEDMAMAESSEFPSERKYYDMIEKKTAALFEAASLMGCILAGGSSRDEKRLSSFGKNFGIAFQLVDDLLGVAGDESLTGKSVGGDLLQGKKTLPVALAFRTTSDDDRTKLLRVFGKKKARAKDVNVAIEIIRKCGAQTAVRKQAKLYAKRAFDQIALYNDSKAKRDLKDLEVLVATRQL
ncbi:MAG: polyprenyl synthetase family protein [Thaumarchaeota archaeon]|nr:polyprenyl synthetase family protein [Nitrososphaerota archaeon]